MNVTELCTGAVVQSPALNVVSSIPFQVSPGSPALVQLLKVSEIFLPVPQLPLLIVLQTGLAACAEAINDQSQPRARDGADTRFSSNSATETAPLITAPPISLTDSAAV